MLPTMYHIGILVATLFAVSLGEDPTDAPTRGPPSLLSLVPPNAPTSLMDMCFLGSVPTVSCRFKCQMMHKDAHCSSDGSGRCMCQDKVPLEEEEDENDDLSGIPPFTFNQPAHDTPMFPPMGHPTMPTPHLSINFHPLTSTERSQSEPAPDKKRHVVFYIFDLNKIFGRGNKTDQTATAEEQQTEGTDGTPEGMAPAGWAFQHVVALLIVILLFVLILLELYACYKKQTSKTNMESIFNTVPMPNKS